MLFPHPIEAVLFDMDGLLVDTEALVRDAMLSEAEALGHPMPLALFLQTVGLPAHASDELTQKHFGERVDVAAYNAAVERRVKERLEAGVALKQGVVELLDLLDALDIPRAIVTSSSHATVEAHLGRSRIIPRFHAVIAHGDYIRGKPHPDPFLRAAEVLKTPAARCLVLEDSHNGIRAAHAAGMIAIMVPDLVEPTEEVRGLCFAVVETLHEVREALLQARGRTSPEA